MWVPLEKKEDKWQGAVGTGRTKQRDNFFLNFYSLSFLSHIPEFLTVGIRRDKHEKCSTRRGLRVGNKNTRFHREFK